MSNPKTPWEIITEEIVSMYHKHLADGDQATCNALNALRERVQQREYRELKSREANDPRKVETLLETAIQEIERRGLRGQFTQAKMEMQALLNFIRREREDKVDGDGNVGCLVRGIASH